MRCSTPMTVWRLMWCCLLWSKPVSQLICRTLWGIQAPVWGDQLLPKVTHFSNLADIFPLVKSTWLLVPCWRNDGFCSVFVVTPRRGFCPRSWRDIETWKIAAPAGGRGPESKTSKSIASSFNAVGLMTWESWSALSILLTVYVSFVPTGNRTS